VSAKYYFLFALLSLAENFPSIFLSFAGRCFLIFVSNDRYLTFFKKKSVSWVLQKLSLTFQGSQVGTTKSMNSVIFRRLDFMVGVESTKGRFRNYNTFSVIVNSASALSNKTLSPINSSRNFHHNQTGNHIKLLLIEKKRTAKFRL